MVRRKILPGGIGFILLSLFSSLHTLYLPPVHAGQDTGGDTPAGLEFVTVRAGQFQMGCSRDANATECDRDERPAHAVQITKDFEIGKTEVTQKQWQAVMGTNPSGHHGGLNLPVENVTFEQVQEFITKLNATNSRFLYRLPTEAEWEYAARAGTTDQYAGILDGREAGDRGFRGNLEPYPVETKKPNPWGIYDMRGNVQEWVADWYDSEYYSRSPAMDPKGPATGDGRVARGSSFRAYAGQYYPFLFRVSVRNQFPEAYSSVDLGFRLVRENR